MKQKISASAGSRQQPSSRGGSPFMEERPATNLMQVFRGKVSILHAAPGEPDTEPNPNSNPSTHPVPNLNPNPKRNHTPSGGLRPTGQMRQGYGRQGRSRGSALCLGVLKTIFKIASDRKAKPEPIRPTTCRKKNRRSLLHFGARRRGEASPRRCRSTVF